jgi:hypothetical protein
MTTAQIPLSGLLDLDSSNEAIKPGYHKRARNIMFRGGRAENLLGTRKISYTLPAGTNECIGSYYDATKQRTIWFNWNSNNKHGIYQMVNEVITPITVCGTTDYLNFSKYPIHSVNILYGDETLGDILYFIDSLKRPTKINITRAIAGGYGAMQRSYLNVAKEPPLLPPVPVYANDAGATVNNLRNSVFQFAYTWIFDDKEESTLSFFSAVPTPTGILDQNQTVTTNAKISVTLQTGKANVKKIKLYARHNVDGNYSDLFLIDIFDKTILSIPDNSTYTYDFKNNTIGVAADVKFATHLFDYVPREANTQELVNGNIVVYGAVKEGYNNGITPNVTFTVNTSLFIDGPYDITPAYSFWSWYTFAIVYFDDQMRTNGVAYETKINVYTGADPGIGIPQINVSVAHRPPVWATSYQWVRSKNNTKSKFIQWISDSTYKDDKFAYIGIQNLYTKLPGDSDKTVLTYDYTPGDRVRFLRIGTSGTMIGKDYAIEEMVNSPDVNYVPKSGTYLKIKLPTLSGTFDFGTTGFGNYLIEIYTPAEATSDKLNTYFEFGAVYQIGNPGQFNRYHKGQTQDQAPDLSIPATFSFTKGDVYLKVREISVGSGGQYRVDAADAWAAHMFIGVHLMNNIVGNETFVLGETPFAKLPLSGTVNQWIIKTQGDPYTFRIKGTIKVNSPISLTYRAYLEYYTLPNTLVLTQIDVIPDTTLTIGDNELSFDKTFTIPANSRVYFITDNSNNQALHFYATAFTINAGNALSRKIFDPNFSDTFLSAVNSNGRPFVVDEGMVETYKPDMIRYSEAYQSGTNLNRMNRFFPLNYETCDRAKGDIQRLKVRGDMLRAFQYRGVLPFGVYKQMLTNAEGSSNLIQSERLLNRIKYYDGEYGIGNQSCSLASSSGADYFTDPVRGYHIRLAGDGMTPISEIYKAQYYLPPVAANFLKSYTTDTGALSKIIGVYDYFNEEFVSIFQKCIKDGITVYEGDTLGFSEQRNGYSSFYDYMPESIVCAENTFIMWKAGEIYMQDSISMNTFFGEYSPSQMVIVLNVDPNVKKEFLSIGYHSNEVWECPEITTALLQESNLITSDFVLNEGMYTAAFLRDANSPGSLTEGDYLKGVWQQILLQSDTTETTYITGLYINYSPSPKVF